MKTFWFWFRVVWIIITLPSFILACFNVWEFNNITAGLLCIIIFAGVAYMWSKMPDTEGEL